MKFVIQEDSSITSGTVIYVKNDYAFTFEPVQSASYTILVNDLNISFDWNMYAKQVWGYNPYGGWVTKDLTIPTANKGKLVLASEVDGIKRLDGTKEWVTYFDEKKGWCCIGDETCGVEDKAIEFASNTIAILRAEYLKAIWLKPIFR
jgi:hypothetical protein